MVYPGAILVAFEKPANWHGFCKSVLAGLASPTCNKFSGHPKGFQGIWKEVSTMNLVPFRRNRETGMARLHDDFDRMMDRFFGDWGWPALRGESWGPAMDIAERDDAIVVKAELPGMKADDLNISVQGNALTISGEKKDETEDKKEHYYHVERRYGSFQRAVMLPTEVDVDRIEAQHRDGVLTITLPKSETARPRQIKIKS